MSKSKSAIDLLTEESKRVSALDQSELTTTLAWCYAVSASWLDTQPDRARLKRYQQVEFADLLRVYLDQNGLSENEAIAILRSHDNPQKKCWDINDLIFCSFRYYLGRMTGSTILFAETLAENWDQINPNTQALIEKELEAAFNHDDDQRERGDSSFRPLGMDCDREAWENVRKCYARCGHRATEGFAN
jgi:hypothetical protein